eukprot:TRINITY_DN800_c0_g1_i1.p1 TRINITY_DN800_c0_g1~~TRINITY_DN800_c0_g1_i1.p1  ORF type:complete len:685 (+),score=179.48 TRINITY_DN800_c0_g1_i1:102-2057(+)
MSARVDMMQLEEERCRYVQALDVYKDTCRRYGVGEMKGIVARLTVPRVGAVCMKEGCWEGVDNEEDAKRWKEEHPYMHVCREKECGKRSEKHLVHMETHVHLGGLVFNMAHVKIPPLQVQALSEAFASHADLTEVRLNQCHLYGTSAAPLIASLTHSPNLTTLEMYNNSLDPASLPFESFRTLFTRLRVVKLNGNPLGDIGITILSNAIQNCDAPLPLEELYLNDVGLSAAGFRVLMSALPHAKRLRTLAVRSNNLHPSCSAQISQFISGRTVVHCDHCQVPIGSITPTSTKTWFCYSCCLLLKDPTHSCFSLCIPSPDMPTPSYWYCTNCRAVTGPALTHPSQTRTVITELLLRGNDIRDVGAMVVADGLSGAESLKSLELKDCCITGVGVARLIEQCTVNLTALNLNGNHIGDEAAKVLAAYLPQLRLRTLGLQDVKITGQGGIYISEAVRRTGSLQGLDISCNDLGDGFAAHLGETLAVNKVLESLDLHECGMSPVGVVCLTEVLAYKNRSVTHLDFSRNVSSAEGAKGWHDVITLNKTLVRLSLTNNQLDLFGVAAVIDALRTNTTLLSIHLFCTSADRRANFSTPETRRYLHTRRTNLPKKDDVQEPPKKHLPLTINAIKAASGLSSTLGASMPTLLGSLASSIEG